MTSLTVQSIDNQQERIEYFCSGMLHIGQEIQRKAKEIKVSAAELAEKINTTKQNVYLLFKRKSIDTDQLEMISKALGYDFFDLYKNQEREHNARVNSEKIILEQNQKIKDYEVTIRNLNMLVEEMKVKYGAKKEPAEKKKV